MKKLITLFATFFAVTAISFATTKTFTGNGNWSDGTKWSPSAPGVSDAAVISAGSVCNMNATSSCASLTISGGTAYTRLQFSGAFTLTVTGSVVLSAPTADNIGTSLCVNTGTITCTSITMPSTTNTLRTDTVTLSTGTITCSANITCSGGTTKNFFFVTDAGTVNLGGNFSGATMTSVAGSTFNYNGSGTQNVCTGSYGYLNFTGASIKTLTGTTTVANDLSVASTSTLATTSRTYTVTGLSNIDGALTGTSGTKTFSDLMTISSAGSVNMTGGTSVFNNSISNDGTTCVFSTASFTVADQSLSGSSSYTFTTISIGAGLTLQNNATITVNASITGTSGTFQNKSAGRLTFKGSSIAVATFTASSSGNNVTYDRTTAQTIKLVDYYDLVITGDHTTTSVTIPSGTINITGSVTANTTFTTGKFSVNTASTFSFAGTTSISGTGTPTFHNLTIASGTLTGPSSGTIQVQGNWSNNSGTSAFVPNGCTVIFSSSTSRTIGGTSGTTFHNITCKNTNASGLKLSAATSLTGLLDMSTASCKFDVSTGSLTLESTGLTNDLNASIGQIVGTFVGNITWKRYVSGNTQYRMIGCPIASKTVANWQTFFTISGIGSDTTGVNGGAFYSLTTYDESLTNGNTFDDGYVNVTSAATSISSTSSVNKGFNCFIGTTTKGTAMTPFTISLSGAITSGTQTTLNLANSDGGASGECGYHLIANPYPSAVDYELLTTTGVTQYWYVDPSTGTYYSATTGVIAAGQSFLVEVGGSGGTLQFTEASKTTGSSSNQFYKTQNNLLNTLELNLLSESTNLTTRANVVFKENASDNYVIGSGDARRIASPNKNIHTIATLSADAKLLETNAFGGFNKSFSIPVSIKTPEVGEYVIFSKGISLPGQCLVIKDVETGKEYDLTKDVRISFTSNTTEANNRFVIVGSEPIRLNDEFVASTKRTAHKTVITPANDDVYTYEVKNENNEVVKTVSKKGTLELIDLNPGTYQVNATSVNSCNAITKTISVPSNTTSKMAATTTVEPVVYKTVEGIMIEEAVDSKIQVIDITGKTMFTGDAKDAKILISTNGYASGIYFVKLTNAQNKTSVQKVILD